MVSAVVRSVLICCLAAFAAAQVCVDYTAKGYYTSGGSFVSGLPANIIPIPDSLSYCELEQLEQDCVDRINKYRSGELKFSDGSSDPGVPKPALTHLEGNDRCSSAQAAGDLNINGGSGGCTGAHATSFNCPWKSSVGQNTCCYRTGSTYSQIRTQLFNCLQQMWDEGIGQPDNAAFTSANGHWYNMRKSANKYVHCGFAFRSNGAVWMNQDFSAGLPTSVEVVCSCADKQPGDSDGCGGTCVGTGSPTTAPTAAPTPSKQPTSPPTSAPTSPPPTPTPSKHPTSPPTSAPTFAPTFPPTSAPTFAPTFPPTSAPTFAPTLPPTSAPTFAPTLPPTSAPTFAPTSAPTTQPTSSPTNLPPASSPTAPATGSNPQTVPGSTANSNANGGPDGGVIAGAVIGALLIVVAIGLGVFFYRRHTQQSSKGKSSYSMESPRSPPPAPPSSGWAPAPVASATPRAPAAAPAVGGSTYTALYAYDATQGDELSFSAGDQLTNVRPAAESGWLTGTLARTGAVGLFPANYVQSATGAGAAPARPAPPPPYTPTTPKAAQPPAPPKPASATLPKPAPLPPKPAVQSAPTPAPPPKPSMAPKMPSLPPKPGAGASGFPPAPYR